MTCHFDFVATPFIFALGYNIPDFSNGCQYVIFTVTMPLSPFSCAGRIGKLRFFKCQGNKYEQFLLTQDPLSFLLYRDITTPPITTETNIIDSIS